MCNNLSPRFTYRNILLDGTVFGIPEIRYYHELALKWEETIIHCLDSNNVSSRRSGQVTLKSLDQKMSL